MIKPRYYQEEAVDAIFEYWQTESGNPLVDLSTGTGKSLCMAMLSWQLVDQWPDMRVMNIAHREELVGGNFKELLGLWEFAPAGIFAASLGRRDAHAQIVFAQIQTVWNKVDAICQVVRNADGDILSSNPVDVLEIDEVHLVPSKDETMYGAFIKALLEINPDMKIVGFTATPYRMDSGRLDEGDNRMFDKIVYTYSISQGIEDGYLAPLSSKGMSTGFDLTGVASSGGEYRPSALAKAVDKDEVTRAAVAETIALSEGRNTALFFCSGVEHANHVRDEVRRHGKTCETVHGGTPKGERRKIIADLKSGKLWSATNDAVLTVGTNIPNIDLIADLAPTKSTSRFVQKAGRGTRPVYEAGFNVYGETTTEQRLSAIANGPKQNCLYLDFAKNIAHHGPVDQVQPKEPGKGNGDAPVKMCPNQIGMTRCDELVHISVMTCPCCGYEFPPSEDVKLTSRAAITPILSTEKPEWHVVTGRSFRFHDKVGGTPSVKVTYSLDGDSVSEWVCPQHENYAKDKSDKYWDIHGGQQPAPSSVDEFLDRACELLITSEIKVKFKGKWPEVLSQRAGAEAANDNEVRRGNLVSKGRLFSRGANSPAVATKEEPAPICNDDFIPF